MTLTELNNMRRAAEAMAAAAKACAAVAKESSSELLRGMASVWMQQSVAGAEYMTKALQRAAGE